MAGRFSIEAIFKGTDRFSPMLGVIGSNARRFSSNFGAAIGQMNGMIDRFAGGLKTAVVAGGALGAVVGAGLIKIGTAGANFEQQITDVGAVLMKSRDQIGDLEQKALALGVSTQFSETQVAAGMEAMARKGFNAKEILGGISGVLDAAAASGLEVADVAGHVGAVLRGMGLDASKTTRVADVLALASSKTGATIDMLGESMANVGATARSLGVPLENTVAAVGLLQKVGIDASTAGTAVSTMLTKLAKPSAEITGVMRRFGITFKDAHGDMLPFEQVLANINTAAQRSGGSLDRVGFLTNLVGIRGEKAALNLTKLFESGELGTLTKDLEAAEGSARRMAALRMNTLKGDFILLESTVQVLETSLSGLREGALRDVLQGANAWLATNKDLVVSGVDEWLKRLTLTMDLFADGVGLGFSRAKAGVELLVAPFGSLGKMLDKGPSWLSSVNLLGQAIGGLGPALIGFAIAVKVANGAMTAWNAVMALNPTTAVILGVAALGVVVVAYLPEIKRFAQEHEVLFGFLEGGAVTLGVVTVATKVWGAASLTSASAVTVSRAALLAWNGIAGVGLRIAALFTTALEGQTLATTANAARTWLASAATGAWTGVQNLYAVAVGRSTAATLAGAEAAGVAEASLLPLVVTVGAATAAIGALVAAWTEWQGLTAQSGGHTWEGIKGAFAGAGGGWEGVEKGYFNAVDSAMNDDARRNAAGGNPSVAADASGASSSGMPRLAPAAPPPQVVGLSSAGLDSAQLASVISALKEGQRLEVDVKAAPGTSAEVKETKGSSKNAIKVTNSGALRKSR